MDSAPSRRCPFDAASKDGPRGGSPSRLGGPQGYSAGTRIPGRRATLAFGSRAASPGGRRVAGDGRFPVTPENALRAELRLCRSALPRFYPGAPGCTGRSQPGKGPGLAGSPGSLPLGEEKGIPSTLSDRPASPSPLAQPACRLLPGPWIPRGPPFLKGLAHSVIHLSGNVLTLLIPQHDDTVREDLMCSVTAEGHI